MPEDILGENYTIVKEIINNFSKSRAEWDEYAKKIDPSIRNMMKKAFHDCRENGFFGPWIGKDGELSWCQEVEMSEPINEVYLAEISTHDGKGIVKEIKKVAKEYLRPDMRIIEKVRQGK